VIKASKQQTSPSIRKNSLPWEIAKLKIKLTEQRVINNIILAGF
jgi:hypothetical protein